MKYIELKEGKVVAGPFEVTEIPDLTGSPHTTMDVTSESPMPKEGWTYANSVFTEPLVAVEELRLLRNQLLSYSDWTDLPSYPGTDQTAWRVYRQELRDITEGYTPVASPVWPTQP